MCDLNGFLDDPMAATLQVFNNWQILLWGCVSILSVMLFNVNGLILTQNVSATFRAIWDAMRTIIITACCYLLPAPGGGTLDTFVLKNALVQFTGFGILV